MSSCIHLWCFSELLWCFGIRKPVLKKIYTFFSDTKKNHSKKLSWERKKCSDEKTNLSFSKWNLVIEPLSKSQHLTPSELREKWICIFSTKSGRNCTDHGYGMGSPFKDRLNSCRGCNYSGRFQISRICAVQLSRHKHIPQFSSATIPFLDTKIHKDFPLENTHFSKISACGGPNLK